MSLQIGNQLIHRFLESASGGVSANVFTTGGTGTGVSTGDAPGGVMSIGPSTGEKWVLHRMIINIDGSATVSSTKYGDQAAQSPGVLVYIKDSSGIIYSLGGTTQSAIADNFGWTRVCYDSLPVAYNSKKPIVTRWSFNKSGEPIILDGDQSQEIAVQFRAGTTGLGNHTFQIQGYKLEK